MREDGNNGNNAKKVGESRDASHPSHSSQDADRLLPPRGDYRTLLSFPPQTFECCREFVETRPPVVVANIAICLINQANYLIDRQLIRLEKDFLEQGGLRERMTRLRLQYRRPRPPP
jgi:four helix bundle suffix protein